jgi:hypothetical protein
LLKHILIIIIISLSASAFAAGGHNGIAHDSTGHHTGGATKSYGNSNGVTIPDFQRLEQEHLASQPTQAAKPKNNYDVFMDAFKRNPHSTPTAEEIKVPKTGTADNYRDDKGILRDGKTGDIHRSQNAIKRFRDINPCPGTGRTEGACPGYQVDHRTALKNGGADDPSNMRWLSTADHQKKSAHE